MVTRYGFGDSQTWGKCIDPRDPRWSDDDEDYDDDDGGYLDEDIDNPIQAFDEAAQGQKARAHGKRSG
jgi:hypothetical protein